MNIKFYKMTGAGNDFIFLPGEDNHNLRFDEKLIARMCDRRYGIGADGLIFIRKSEECDYEIFYFNSDGKPGSLCGNGSRCSLIFANNFYNKKNSYIFKCGFNLYKGDIINKTESRFYLNPPSKIKLNFMIKAASQLIKASFADVGSPHVVINIQEVAINPKNPLKTYNDLSIFPAYELGKEIRWHKDFEPEGVNVNFITINNENEISIRTFERGVEDETFACGTGSVSSALISFLNYNLKPPIKLKTKGGDILTVGFNFENQQFYNVYLEGPAKIVYSGEYILEEQ